MDCSTGDDTNAKSVARSPDGETDEPMDPLKGSETHAKALLDLAGSKRKREEEEEKQDPVPDVQLVVSKKPNTNP